VIRLGKNSAPSVIGRVRRPIGDFRRGDAGRRPEHLIFVLRFLFHLNSQEIVTMLRKFIRDRKGQGLVEYALLIAGVALIGAAGVSLFGHKTSQLISAVAAVLPGAHAGDNAPIAQGELIETTSVSNPYAAGGTAIALDLNTIAGASNQPRLADNVIGASGTNYFNGLVVDAQ
jgi:Flp pilus assembly pilin Flp